ncbi:MAG: hypothetical protein HRT86_10130 [Ilumatobacteraceae bacterium]|nr:hypothetical protein [Ilumatobacteraceae bacterium]
MSDEERLAKIDAVLPGRWDPPAIRAGAIISLVLAVPLTVIAAIVDSDEAGVQAAFFFAAFGGFVIGAGCAAWIQRCGTPLSHGLLTATGTYAAAQAVFIVIQLIAGGDVNWFGVFFTLTLVLGAGLVGGFLGSRLQSKGIRPSSRAHPGGM